jgi:hypothetical protein
MRDGKINLTESSEAEGNFGRGCLILFALAICAGGTGVGYYCFSPPEIEATQRDDHIEIRNRFLEYYIELGEVRVFEQGSSTPLIRAHRGNGRYPSSFLVYPGSLGRTIEGNDSWEFIEDASSTGYLEPGVNYAVQVWGNNGFGFFNPARIQVTLPDAVSETGSNKVGEE